MAIARNKKATFNYELHDKWEAGIQLTGSEASVVRHHGMSLSEAFVVEKNGELFLHDAYIAPHKSAHQMYQHSPKRDRKLLLRKKEISKILGYTTQKGYSVVPVSAYYKGSLIKVEIAAGKGKNVIDKRETVKRREADREARRAMKGD